MKTLPTIPNNIAAISSLLLLLLIGGTTIDRAAAQDSSNKFRTVAMPDTGDTTPLGVVLPAICIGNFIVPKTMYTIEPHDDDDETKVEVLTTPKDLVEVGYDEKDGLYYFKFIQDIVEEDADEAGVIIRFPSDQLKIVNACCSQSVQIKKGFTDFESLTVSTNAIVNASFTVQQNSDVVVGVYTAGEANVRVTETDGDKNTDVKIVAVDNAKVNVNGDITTLSCADQSDCMISGVISDPDESQIRGRSNVETTSCEDIDVTDDSNCRSKTPKVTVKVNNPTTISGVREGCVGGSELSGFIPIEPLSTGPPTISPQPTVSNEPTSAPFKSQDSEDDSDDSESPTLSSQPSKEPSVKPVDSPTEEENNEDDSSSGVLHHNYYYNLKRGGISSSANIIVGVTIFVSTTLLYASLC